MSPLSTTPKMRSATGGSPLMLRLALADLRHEWILTLCLMLAISAVIAPLLLLFGLKYGTIETLRHRLIQDPKNREIRPLSSITHPREWFEEMQVRPDVAFITPMTRQISSSVSAWPANSDGSRKTELDLIPSGPGDALLLDNGAPVPAEGTCVLTEFAAEAAGIKSGDTLTVEVSRMKGSRRETGRIDLKVVGVADRRASAIRAMYVPLSFLEDVEAFKDGQGIPALGWPGDKPQAYPLIDGLLISTAEPLPPLLQNRLRANTGFTRSTELPAEKQFAELGYALPDDRTALLLYTELRPLGDSSITAVENQLRGQGATLLPWIRPIEVSLTSPLIPTPRTFQVRILPAEANRIGTSPSPPWTQALDTGPDVLRALVPPGTVDASGTLTLSLLSDRQELIIPLQAVELPSLAPDSLLVPSRLGGVLRLAQTRAVRFEQEGADFLLYRRGYAGFRLYGRSIEDIEGLRLYFEGKGIPVNTEAQKIQSVREMDRYLTLIFWLIAAVGIGGSIASLIASLYASVERKRRELSVLRLLGLSGTSLFRFPIYQGAFIAGGAFLLAWGFFAFVANVINQLFQAHLQAGESFCRLPLPYALGAWACTILLACLAATAAVARLARIDPAEALRDE